MNGLSKIEWTGDTWNPTTGCTKVSTGCTNCYAERMALRLQAMGQKKYANGFTLTLHPQLLSEPYRWRKPRVVFVNSMSDLFHEDIPVDFILSVFNVMSMTPQHTYQILTKRSHRLLELAPDLPWTENIWMGVTVESVKYYHRIDLLRQVPVHVRFLSLEPLLSAMHNLDLEGIQWVIAGGESGPKARPIHPEWVRQIRDQCHEQDVSFFFKQWGGTNKKVAGRILDSSTYDEMPPIKTRSETTTASLSLEMV